MPAVACDLDHTIPYSDGGTTAATNLAPLCRRDHLLRTHAGHHIEQTTAGTIVWTSLTRRYESTPGHDGHHRMLHDRPAEPPRAGQAGRLHPDSSTDERTLLTARTHLPAHPDPGADSDSDSDSDDEIIPF